MFLDGVAITPEEKVKALNLHAAEGSDLATREKSWAEHFPGRAFANLLPPFVEPEPPLPADS